MKALIFAAGLGTRLRPLTDDRPKALVEVAGVAMLERVIGRVAEAGFDDITINIHHFGQKIIEFLERNRNFGLNIHISDERKLLLDTGGGILKARPWLDGDEPFLVHNADILTDLDLRQFFDVHRRGDTLATLLVKERVTQRYLVFDKSMLLRGWINKQTGQTRPQGFTPDADRMTERAFGGLHVISPAIFPLLEQYARSAGPVFSITPFYIDSCQAHRFGGYEPDEAYNWFDVGKPETLAQAQAFFYKQYHQ